MKTGKIAWKHATNNGAQPPHTTAGNLVFDSDGSGNFVTFDVRTAIRFATPACNPVPATPRSRTCLISIRMF